MIVNLPSVAGNEPFSWAMKNCPSEVEDGIISGEDAIMLMLRYS